MTAKVEVHVEYYHDIIDTSFSTSELCFLFVDTYLSIFSAQEHLQTLTFTLIVQFTTTYVAHCRCRYYSLLSNYLCLVLPVAHLPVLAKHSFVLPPRSCCSNLLINNTFARLASLKTLSQLLYSLLGLPD